MKKDKINFIVAIIIILTPFSGFPPEVRKIFFVISGLIVLVSALRDIRKEYKIKASKEEKDAFVESKPESIVNPDSDNTNINSSHIADA